MFLELSIILIIFILIYHVYITRAFEYWKKKNLPYLKPSIPFGSLENPMFRKHSLSEWLKNIYDEIRSYGYEHAGFYVFSTPIYMPVEPEILKQVMMKDFQYFINRGFYHNEKDDPLSANVFAVGGTKWRHLRTKLTPTFTSGKMKMMFDTFLQCGIQMEEAMDKFAINKQAVDIKDVLGCFTTDIIGSCAFGIDCNSFENPNTQFRKYGKKLFQSTSKLRAIRSAIVFSNQGLARKLRLRYFYKDVADFFMNVVKETVRYRETNNFIRSDMMQLLIDMEDQLTIEEIAAQALVFFGAGFETSSTTMSFCLYELAVNSDIQEKVREEINEVLSRSNGKFTYDAIMEMKYMEQVVDETLRKHPPLGFVSRECVKDYQVPNTDVVIEKGTRVLISILGLHKNEKYFPNPERFNPERFSEDNKKSITPFTYMPFGEGPRLCLGMRFGLMQTKVGLALLLRNYRFSVNKRTVVPFVTDPFTFITTTIGGIWLDIGKV